MVDCHWPHQYWLFQLSCESVLSDALPSLPWRVLKVKLSLLGCLYLRRLRQRSGVERMKLFAESQTAACHCPLAEWRVTPGQWMGWIGEVIVPVLCEVVRRTKIKEQTQVKHSKSQETNKSESFMKSCQQHQSHLEHTWNAVKHINFQTISSFSHQVKLNYWHIQIM